MIRNQNYCFKNQHGMTLVEIILAMAILAIVMIFMSPVMISAFRMIAVSGQRLNTAKGVSGSMEQVIAGQAVITQGKADILLPGSIKVNGSKFTLESNSVIGKVDLDGYMIEPMPFIDPIENTPSPKINIDKSLVDVSMWRSNNTFGKLIFDTALTSVQLSQLEFCIVPERNLSDIAYGWNDVSNHEMNIPFSENDKNYSVIIRQKNQLLNTLSLYIRKAPVVYYSINSGNNKLSFYLYDGSGYDQINNEDLVEHNNSGTWESIPKNYRPTASDFNIDSTLYRFSQSNSAKDATYKDPPSFPSFKAIIK